MNIKNLPVLTKYKNTEAIQEHWSRMNKARSKAKKQMIITDIYGLCQPMINYMLFKWNKSPMTPDEVRSALNEGFSEAINDKLYDPKRSPFSYYLRLRMTSKLLYYYKLKKCAKNVYRPYSIDQEIEGTNGIVSASSIEYEGIGAEDPISDDFRLMLNEARHLLSDKEFTVLSCFLSLGGSGQADVCERLNMNRKEVDNALVRAKRKLRECEEMLMPIYEGDVRSFVRVNKPFGNQS